MFLTVHATAAIIIAQKISQPPVAFLAGYLSHLILDAIPHGDERLLSHLEGNAKIKAFVKLAAVDAIIAVCWLGFLLNRGEFFLEPAVLAALVGSLLPDFLIFLYLVTKHPWLKWNYLINERWTHNRLIKNPLPAPLGFLLQTLVFASMAFYLLL